MVRRTAVRVAMVMVVLSMDFDGMEIVVVSEVTALIEPLKSDRLEPETIWFALSLKMYGDVYTTAVEVMVSVLLSAEELLDTLSAAENGISYCLSHFSAAHKLRVKSAVKLALNKQGVLFKSLFKSLDALVVFSHFPAPLLLLFRRLR